MSKKRTPAEKSDRGGNRIPLSFEKAVEGLLRVKPQAKAQKPKEPRAVKKAGG